MHLSDFFIKVIQYAVVTYHQGKLVCRNCCINNEFKKCEWTMDCKLFSIFLCYFCLFYRHVLG